MNRSEKPIMADGFLKILRRVNFSSLIRGCVVLFIPSSSTESYPRVNICVEDIQNEINDHIHQAKKQADTHQYGEI